MDKGVGATALRHCCLSVGASARRALVEERLVEEGILERRAVEAREAQETIESADLKEPGVRDLLTEVQLYR